MYKLKQLLVVMMSIVMILATLAMDVKAIDIVQVISSENQSKSISSNVVDEVEETDRTENYSAMSVPDPFWENDLVQEELAKTPDTINTTVIKPNLIVVDITGGMDLNSYTALLEEQDNNKSVIGVYSAKLLLDGVEIEADKLVEVELPITETIAQYNAHDVFKIADTLTKVEVKSASAEFLAFDTDKLGYFLVVGDPVTVDETAPVEEDKSLFSIILDVFVIIVLICIAILLLLRIKRNKDEKEN